MRLLSILIGVVTMLSPLSLRAQAAAHRVDVLPMENGLATVSAPSAVAGDVVTVTVYSALGYEFEALTVNDDTTIIVDGGGSFGDDEEVALPHRSPRRVTYSHPVEFSQNADGTFRFTMPDANVELRATFAKAAATIVGDINANGAVEIGDVTMLVNLILSQD